MPYCSEAFAAWVPGWGVPLSYAIAITYVLVDTFDKYSRARKQARIELDSIDLEPSVDADRCAASCQPCPLVIAPLPCHGRPWCGHHLSSPVSCGGEGYGQSVVRAMVDGGRASVGSNGAAQPGGRDACRLVGLLAADNALDTVVWQMLASVIIPGCPASVALARPA